jgi:hypothetical protein
MTGEEMGRRPQVLTRYPKDSHRANTRKQWRFYEEERREVTRRHLHQTGVRIDLADRVLAASAPASLCRLHLAAGGAMSWEGGRLDAA